MIILTDMHWYKKSHNYSDDECGFDDSDSEYIYSHTEENSNEEIINRCDFGQRHLIGARLSSTTTLLESDEPEELMTLHDTSNNDSINDNVPSAGDRKQQHTYYFAQVRTELSCS